MDGWSDFVREVKQYYDVDMSCLTEAYQEEQADYFSRTAAWADVHPSQALGPPACLKSYDLLMLTLEELKADLQASFKLRLLQPGPVEALAGYFDVQFRGSPENPADSPVTLTTAPDPTGVRLGARGCIREFKGRCPFPLLLLGGWHPIVGPNGCTVSWWAHSQGRAS